MLNVRCSHLIRWRRHRRGSVFIIAIAITVILSAMLLVFAQQMRTESIAGGQRMAQAKADAVEQGAEQWVLAQVEANVTPLVAAANTTNTTTTPIDPTTIPAEALQVGDGYFWLLHPDPAQDQTYAFGLVDESGKLNLNGATADELTNLPNMPSNLPELIQDWPSTTGSVGSALSYESVEELLLVDQTMTPTILYGYDLNHDGVIDKAEMAASNGAATSNGSTIDSRGIFNYVTVYSTSATPGTQGTTTSSIAGGRGRAAGVIPRTIGLVNVNTAPSQVLACLPGMTAASADSLVGTRTSASLQSPTDISWVASAGVGATLAQYITGTSYQYSADIVAVSGDGRSFKRVRIVVDARTSPAIIVYRKDLTSLGWPLPEEVRTSLRAGKGVPQDVTGTANAQTASGLNGTLGK